MPRSTSVSENVWAQAIHAVTVQKLSLRRAAQLYGVHHMSLHRRVRGRYTTNPTSQRNDDCDQTFVEDENTSEQCKHEHDADNVRYTSRTVPRQEVKRDNQNSEELPLNQWISKFKVCEDQKASSPTRISLHDLAIQHQQSSQNQQIQHQQHPFQHEPTTFQLQHPTLILPKPPHMTNIPTPASYLLQEEMEQHDSTSDSDSEHHPSSERRSTTRINRHRHAVSFETWEKAVDAVEIQGMSLRTAAKLYGVHFAALYRRVKKRALRKEQVPILENYIPFEDEAGIVRVIHARADLGILMTYEELVDLLNRTALKHMTVTPETSRMITRRFQTRVGRSIRHLIQDWPLPRLDSIYHPPYSSALTSTSSTSSSSQQKTPSPPHPHHLMNTPNGTPFPMMSRTNETPVYRPTVYNRDDKEAMKQAAAVAMIRL